MRKIDIMNDNVLCRIPVPMKQALTQEFDKRCRVGTRISWHLFENDWLMNLESDLPSKPTVRSVLYDEKKKAAECRIIDGLCRLLLGCTYEEGLQIALPKFPSKAFVERPELEEKIREIIVQPGSLLRIKSPASMGKTLLINKILNKLDNQNYTIVKYDCLEVDQQDFKSYNQFGQNFCYSLIEKLDLSEDLLSNWKPKIGANLNLTRFFEKYFFKAINNDLILAIYNFDLLLENEQISSNICHLFRLWFNNARQGDNNSENWQRFHLILVHSTDVYAKLDIHVSPLANLGNTIELEEFNREEVEDLSQQYNLSLNAEDIDDLMELVGGHPFLVDSAFQYLNDHRNDGCKGSLDFILSTATEERGIYANHLRKILGILQDNSELQEAFKTVLSTSKTINLNNAIISWQLYSLGLIKRSDDDKVEVRCSLYRKYFSKHLL